MIVEINIFSSPKQSIYTAIISDETKNWPVPFSKEPVRL